MTEKHELPGYIREALRGRRYTDAQIDAMPAEKIFDQYCGWVLGDTQWGANLRAVMHHAEKFARSQK